jgi:hypothetical protein
MTNGEFIHLAHIHGHKQLHTQEAVHRNLDKKPAAARTVSVPPTMFLSS